MAGLCIICGIMLTVFFQRGLAVPIIIVALGLLWLYSYPPARISYRGAGEILQMLGVGLVLPVFGYYAQSGSIHGFPFGLLPVILPTQLACAMATSLPDEPSDRLSGKQTSTVLLGAKTTKYSILFLNAISIASIPFVSWFSSGDIRMYLLLVIPFFAAFSKMFVINSGPGSFKLTVFVFLSVLITLSLMAGMTILFFL